MEHNTIERPPRELVEALARAGSASTSGALSHRGIRNPHIRGPVSQVRGKCVAGPALTLQFMPRREDLDTGAEYEDPESQVHRHVLYQAEAGDVVVVDARANMHSGVFGEMMMTYLKGRGGAGIVVDGCIRDSAKIHELGLGVWVRGATPNYHTQVDIFPYAVNVPIACGGCLVMPGDIIVADDDGAVVVPIALAPEIARETGVHNEWEEFSRLRLLQGGDLRRYYPLSAEAEKEFREWKQSGGTPERERPLRPAAGKAGGSTKQRGTE